MAEEAAATISLGTERSDDESEIDTDFEIDDEEIQNSLNSLLNIPLEFEDSSDEDQEEEHTKQNEKTNEKSRSDSVERQLEAMFVGDKEDPGGGGTKDTGLENISDNDFDGPESGECDTSDGELPDSPNIVVTLPDTPPILPSTIQDVDDVSLDEDSDVELLEEYQTRGREFCNAVTQKITLSKPDREVIIDTRIEPDIHRSKERKDKDSSKLKEKNWDKSKSKDKKDKNKKKIDIGVMTVDMKKKLKLKKYLARLDQYRAKCLEYMSQISKKCDILKNDEKNKIRIETEKIRMIKGESKLKSIVEKVNNNVKDHDIDELSHCSLPPRFEKGHTSLKSFSSEKERKTKSDRKPRSKSKELKEHKLKYQRYIAYLQSERKKCYEERLALGKHKYKSKRKHRKSESRSPDKIREKQDIFEMKISRPPVLSFSEFCNSRELSSPDKELSVKIKEAHINRFENRKERTLSIDSIATTSTAQSTEHIEHVDDDKELFITYSDLIQQDKLKETKQQGENKDSIETESEKDPEMENISVFTSVLFKGSADSGEIPFLQESCPPSPKTIEIRKPKTAITPSTEPDELYDWKDDLSNISQSSLSPSRSPVPKIHNKALLNFLENEKEHVENRKIKKLLKKSLKPSRSRSKSPKKEISRSKKKRSKHHSSNSISISPSPPPLKARSPEVYKKRPSPPAYLKERWRDYASPTERRREHYERKSMSRRRSRSRTRPRSGHRSRSSSEERHYRRYRSRSRSRSRSPPALTMVQLTNAEKRRRLKEEHEKALASLRATIPKPMSTTPLAITFRADGDSFEPIRDNYDPVGMNEVSGQRSVTWNQAPPTNGHYYRDCWNYTPSNSSHPTPQYYYHTPIHHL